MWRRDNHESKESAELSSLLQFSDEYGGIIYQPKVLPGIKKKIVTNFQVKPVGTKYVMT